MMPQLQPSGSFVAQPFGNLSGSYNGYAGGYPQYYTLASQFNPIPNYQNGASSLGTSHNQNPVYDMGYAPNAPQPYGSLSHNQNPSYDNVVQPGPYGFTPSGLPQMGLPPLQPLNLLPPSGSFTLNSLDDGMAMNPLMTQGGGYNNTGSPRYGGGYGGGAGGPFVFYPTFEEKPSAYSQPDSGYGFKDQAQKQPSNMPPKQAPGPMDNQTRKPLPNPKQTPIKTRDARPAKKKQPRRGCC